MVFGSGLGWDEHCRWALGLGSQLLGFTLVVKRSLGLSYSRLWVELNVHRGLALVLSNLNPTQSDKIRNQYKGNKIRLPC